MADDAGLENFGIFPPKKPWKFPGNDKPELNRKPKLKAKQLPQKKIKNFWNFDIQADQINVHWQQNKQLLFFFALFLP